MAESAYARLYAARKGQKKAHEKAERWKKVGDIASEGIGYAAGQADVSSTAWDEYEAGYQEVTGEVSTEERGGMFSKPKGDVRVGERVYSRESFADVGRFKQTLGDSPEGLMNYDRIMSRYKEGAVGEGRLATGEDLGDWLQSDEYKDKLSKEDDFIGPREAPTARKVPEIIKLRRAQQEQAAAKRETGVGVRSTFGKGSGPHTSSGKVLNKPSAWSRFKGGIKKAYDWEKERQVGVQQRRSERMGFDSQNAVTPQDPNIPADTTGDPSSYDIYKENRRYNRGDIPLSSPEDYNKGILTDPKSQGQIFKDGKPTNSLFQTYNNNFARNYNSNWNVDMLGDPIK